MFKFLKTIFSENHPEETIQTDNPESKEPPTEILIGNAVSFPIESHLLHNNGYPLLDWTAVQQWIDPMDSESKAMAWAQCEIAWLEHMRAVLGPEYKLIQENSAVLLSTLEPNLARATLGFMNKTLKRIIRLLDGVAMGSEWGHDILIVFDNEDDYYKYVSHYYQEDGDFASSSGMYINTGCGHFVTMKTDLHTIEPVIAHEMTHSFLSHLPLPLWLNEGLAVNTEYRLCPPGRPLFTPQQMHENHLNFWGDNEIQEFWSGQSFLRNDDGNVLSYDLARILVDQLSNDWVSFSAFANAASYKDAGASAASEHLGIELGEAVSALLEREESPTCSPDPSSWHSNQS